RTGRYRMGPWATPDQPGATTDLAPGVDRRRPVADLYRADSAARRHHFAPCPSPLATSRGSTARRSRLRPAQPHRIRNFAAVPDSTNPVGGIRAGGAGLRGGIPGCLARPLESRHRDVTARPVPPVAFHAAAGLSPRARAGPSLAHSTGPSRRHLVDSPGGGPLVCKPVAGDYRIMRHQGIAAHATN